MKSSLWNNLILPGKHIVLNTSLFALGARAISILEQFKLAVVHKKVSSSSAEVLYQIIGKEKERTRKMAEATGRSATASKGTDC